MITSAAAWARPSVSSRAAKPRNRSTNQHPSTPSTRRSWTRFFTNLFPSDWDESAPLEMKTVISAKDIEELLRNGGDVASLPADAILTPSARDRLRDLEGHGTNRPPPAADAPSASAPRSVTSKSPKAEIEACFHSPETHALKEQICEVGRRLWHRAYVDGNGGNIAIRVGQDIALCTPTLCSKGFMKSEHM